MDFLPAQKEFCATHDKGEAQFLWCAFEADLETPISAWLKLTKKSYENFEKARHACLFETVESGGRHRGRYSIIALAPDLLLRGDAGSLQVMHTALEKKFSPVPQQGFAALRSILSQSRISNHNLPNDFPPMFSGLFGYMGFDTVRLIEKIGENKPDPLGMPDWFFIRPALVAIFDTLKSCIYLVATTHAQIQQKANAKQAYSETKKLLLEAVERMQAALPTNASKHAVANSHTANNNKKLQTKPVSNTTRSSFMHAIAKAKNHIAAGDIFQVVLSQRFSCNFAANPFAYYRALRRINPSPYLYFIDFNEQGIIAGSSPETLVRVQNRKVAIRPLAGTRPRGKNPAEDAALEQELLADEKERAEHLMLLDLGRNDVGKVAKIGSVKIPEQFGIEHYSRVMHIVSHVEGELAQGKDAIDALIAGFPAGTVSGAPKVRAMQILNKLELHNRGLYAGAIGWLGANGDLDTCIALRTAIIKNKKLHVQVGAGIVADSIAEKEFEECENKAQALFNALEIVNQ